jgi:hypothetical protein
MIFDVLNQSSSFLQKIYVAPKLPTTGFLRRHNIKSVLKELSHSLEARNYVYRYVFHSTESVITNREKEGPNDVCYQVSHIATPTVRLCWVQLCDHLLYHTYAFVARIILGEMQQQWNQQELLLNSRLMD